LQIGIDKLTHQKIILSQIDKLNDIDETEIQNQDGNNNNANNECIVCMGEEKDTLFLPCGHYCVCFKCGDEIKKGMKQCPICRSIVQSVTKVYG